MVVAILVYIVLMHFPKTQTFDAFDNHLHFTDNATLPNDRLDLLCAVAPPPIPPLCWQPPPSPEYVFSWLYDLTPFTAVF